MAAPITRPVEAADQAAANELDDYGPQGREEWLEIDWRSTSAGWRCEGGPVNVIELGEGPPLVFVHGHSGRWSNWVEQLPHFARTHRVVAPDLPGFGPPRCRASRSRSRTTGARSTR